MESRHASILEATLRLVARGGVDSVRYRDVAHEAGLSLGTISYHYPIREDLLRAAFAYFLEQDTMMLRSALTTWPVKSLAEIAGFLTEVVRADFANPRRVVLAEYELVVYASRDPVIAKALEQWDRATVAEVDRILEGLGMPAALGAAQTLVDLVRGFQLATLGLTHRDLDGFRDRLHRVVMGLAAGPAARPEKHDKTRARPRKR
jgi:DNA-binding transcriptional regulator YbjK